MKPIFLEVPIQVASAKELDKRDQFSALGIEFRAEYEDTTASININDISCFWCNGKGVTHLQFTSGDFFDVMLSYQEFKNRVNIAVLLSTKTNE